MSQVASLACSKVPGFVEVQVDFDPSPSSSLRVEVTASSASFSWRSPAGEHGCSLRLSGHLWKVPPHRNAYRLTGLRPATLHNFTVEFRTRVPGLDVTLTRRLNVLLETAHCPAGWVHSDSSCLRAWRRGRPWVEAGRACNAAASGSHLADMEREEDFLFISSYLRALNHMVLVWTGLNDLQQEGQLRWTNGVAYSLSSTVTSSLPANQTDCFALQMNATSPSYFFTGFFCYMPLPYMCQYRFPSAPPRFALVLEAVRETEALIGWRDDVEDWRQTGGAAELFLQYQEDAPVDLPRVREVQPGSRGTAVRDLSPGRAYLFSLRAKHRSGATQILGSVLRVLTRPSPPQTLAVSRVTPTELAVQWTAPNSSHNALFHQYQLSWEDAVTGARRSLAVHNHITSAVIGGLKPYHAYAVSVQTSTERGVTSCGTASLTVVTEVGEDNVTVLWDPPQGEGVDGYFVQVRAHAEAAGPREFWVNDSLSYQLNALTPGRKYEIGVAAVKRGNRSEATTILHTQRPRAVEAVLPYELGSHQVALFVQRPAVGELDGFTVLWKGGRHFHPLSEGEGRVTIPGLSPGTVYRFSVYSSSYGVDSTAYSVSAVHTSLVAPAALWEGAVTDSSVEILWDKPEGPRQSYEVICSNCSAAVQVQKVSEERAVFRGLAPGQPFNFSVHTEKEGFADSPHVFRNIRTAPRAPKWLSHSKTHTSVTVRWLLPPGVVDGFVLSIANGTYKMAENFTASDQRMHQFLGLSPGSDYRVDLFSSSGEKMSVPATLNLTTAPAVPEDLTLIQQNEDSMFVTWRPPQGLVEGYQLGYGVSAAQVTRRKLRATEGNTSVEKLTPGAEYQFTLRSFRGEETSEPASQHVLLRPARVCCVSLMHVNSSSVGLAWEPAEGQFDHYRLTMTGASATREVTLPRESLSYTLSGLRDGCTYNLTVGRVSRAVRGAAARLTVTAVPAKPQALRVSSVSSHSFSLRWAGPSGCVDRYHVDLNPAHGQVTVHRMENGEIQSACSRPSPRARTAMPSTAALVLRLSLLAALHPQPAQADVVSVTPGMAYSTAVSAVASSAFSLPVSRSVTTLESIPEPPTGLLGEKVGSTGILLAWTEPPGVKGTILKYIIKYKEVCPYPEENFNQIASLSQEFLLNTLTPGSAYNIKVAAENGAGVGVFSKPLFFQTAEATPGRVVNFTAVPLNHSAVKVRWFLPKLINGLITKFSVRAKLVRSNMEVRNLELNAEDIMDGVIPHCNNAADILTRGTPSPWESSMQTSASAPPVTLSAVPPAASWNIPISVVVGLLRPYTTYVFEVSASTGEGEGQALGYMVRMPESAPEDPPQNLSVVDITSKSFLLTWDPPTIPTGRFSYVLELNGPTGYLYENTTGEMEMTYDGLLPYRRYRVLARAVSNSELGPEAEIRVLTPAEAPSAVMELLATAVDATSVEVSWRSPAQPNGLITQYKILVLAHATVVQNITLIGQDLNETDSEGDGASHRGKRDTSVALLRRFRRDAHTAPTEPPAGVTSAYFLSPSGVTNQPGTATDSTNPTAAAPITSTPPVSDAPVTSTPPISDGPIASTLPVSDAPIASTLSATAFPSGSALSLSPAPDSASSLPWLTDSTPGTELQTPGAAALTHPAEPSPAGGDEVSPAGPRGSSPALPRSTRAAVTADVPASAAAMVSSTEVIDVSADNISYVVTNLSPFTEYTFSVSAFTTVGEGPLAQTTEKTREQVPSSVQNVSYQNISSSSILLSWEPPINPNGRITHYTVYALDLDTKEAFQRATNGTSIVLSELKKYGSYKLRVAASTAEGQSSLSEEDDVFVVTLEDEPDSPPVNLSVASVSASSATITWSPPVLANGVIQFYEIQYRNSTMSATVNSTSPSVSLESLKPFSFYNLTVRAFTKRGHGDQTSEVLAVLSGEDVPGSPPFGLAYESLSSSEVNVTWEAPLLPNGVILSYSVEYWNSTHFLNATTPAASARLSDLRKYARYGVLVRASTRAGSGNHTSDVLNVTTLEDVPSSPPRFLKTKKVSDNQIELFWSPPLEANSEILYYIVSVWNETSMSTYNVTVTSVILEVDEDSQYNATVSSWTRLVPTDPPQNVSYVILSPTSIQVRWSPPTQPNGVIEFYTIYYTDNSTVLAQRVNVSEGPPGGAESQFSAVLEGLSKGTEYSVWMSSSTPHGEGDARSDIVNLYTMEDVPDGPIYNLTAKNISSTIVLVTWDPPLSPNGKVTYHLSLEEEHKTQLSSNETLRETTTELAYLFTKRRKYTLYRLTVTPATSAGSAVNSTSVLYLRTQDDVPSSRPIFKSSRNVSSSSIYLSWLPPLEPNGILTEYSVVLQGPGGANTTLTPSTSLTLTGLLAFSPYNVSIAAGNRWGLGPSLTLLLHTDEAGPAAPPRRLSVYNHTASSVWLVWEASPEPNGLVQFYGFRILELRRQALTFQNSSGPSTRAELTGFRPHSVYEISVSSFTRAGNGNQYSDPVTFTTNQSVSEAVRNLSCSGRGWDSVFLEWEGPDEPNGELTHYLVRYGEEEEEEEEEIEPQALWHTLSGLQPHTHYSFLLMAVNSAGPGDGLSCNASTEPESVPGPPRHLNVTRVEPTGVTLSWAAPESVPGRLQEYRVRAQLLSGDCQAWGPPACVGAETLAYANGSAEELALESLRKYSRYRFSVSARTGAGYGDGSPWVTTRTLPGDPDVPPRSVSVTASSTAVKIEWEEPEQLAGPTSYLIHIVDGPGVNQTLEVDPEEKQAVTVSNLTAYTVYQVTVLAFTGNRSTAWQSGKASEPVFIRTQEDQPKDPPKNVTLELIPEEVTSVYVTFSPPAEPNGNISGYQVRIYRDDQLDFQIAKLPIIRTRNQTITGMIKGLKGGYNYRIVISAVNGAGLGPSSEVELTTEITAPPKPTQKPQVAVDKHGVLLVTARTMTIMVPTCFFSDRNGPIQKLQVIVAEEWVMDDGNLTNWKNAFNYRPAPYLTDEGLPNPTCFEDVARRAPNVDTYIIGEDDSCMAQEDNALCNGPLKPKTPYVFKFRAVNSKGQFTDSDFSERTRTTGGHQLTRDEEIILGVLLSFFLAVLLILIIYASVRIHQKQKEGGTYSPREAEIIDTKFKLDQLIAVADLELKEENLNRYSSFFFRRKEIFVIQLLSYRKSLKPVNKKSFLQHVEDLCANENVKFLEEFSELPKLLHDLATSDADLPWNRSKNRFTNIKPYNNNRVKLLSEPGVPGSDYINASFVSGYLCPNEFIATQGPLPGTVADFWRMVWETRSRTIAMLTQCFEKGRIRCHQYWPEDNKPVTVFGDIVITKLSEEVRPDWTVRVLKVERHGDYMVVSHFNFTSWPEHGVPESSTTLIQFVQAIRGHREQDNTTMVVHCSAGVGRTGVFIALDHLVQHVRDHDFVDIYGLVAELRSERMCMVQNLAQYMFLHQSTLDLLNSKGNSQSVWFVSYSALEKMDSLDAMEGDVELEWEETTM
ncbi:phosphatidylinositol phosphatase PTPRQ [Conger conger]|uniref:phosphatidylinositol phosphatase PTPRQ n=1 Tax=Conger conger TaxID=82655 RepID=UPI002A5A3ACB|nr:phosphatidylinositol phosphatase PTPRQ [Conger conger]